jgi:hypothetical protein
MSGGIGFMDTWVDALQNVAFFTGVSFAARELLVAAISLWSLRADEKGRAHALKLLRLLRVQVRRSPDPLIEPRKHELPDGPKDPPMAGAEGAL